jgi:hypothetical protein
MKKIISVVVVVAIFLVIEVAQAATIFVPVSNTISRAEAIRIGEIANENGGVVVSFECSKHGTLVFIRNKRETKKNARSFFSLGREEIIILFITLDGNVSTGPSEWAVKIRKEVQEIIK